MFTGIVIEWSEDTVLCETLFEAMCHSTVCAIVEATLGYCVYHDISIGDTEVNFLLCCFNASFVILFFSSFTSHSYFRPGLSNWRPAGRIRPAGRVDPAREAKLDFCNIVEMLTIIQQ